MSKYFFCYNSDLGKYLKSKGLNYVTRAKHYKSNKEFSLFEVTDTLEQYIKEFNKMKTSHQ
jgi:hypothetical protein